MSVRVFAFAFIVATAFLVTSNAATGQSTTVSSTATPPTVYIWPASIAPSPTASPNVQTGTTPAPSPTALPALPSPDTVTNNISQILNISRRYTAIPTTGPVDSGYLLRTIVSVVTPAPKSTSPTSYLANISIINAATFSVVGSGTLPFTGTFSGQNPTTYLFNPDDLLAIFAGPQQQQVHADVVIINESPTDTQTAGTGFNGPVYAESRLIAELGEADIVARPIADYLAQNSGSLTNGVITNTDSAFQQACKDDSHLYGLRYVVQYSETRNPFFGSLNGHAEMNLRIQHCGADFNASPALASYGDAHYLGNTGQLLPQYFQFLNWALSRGRLNPNYRGVLGSSGLIASSLLPSAPDTAAESTAVGIAAGRMSCAISLYINGDPNRRKFYAMSDISPTRGSFNGTKACADSKLWLRRPLFSYPEQSPFTQAATPTPSAHE